MVCARTVQRPFMWRRLRTRSHRRTELRQHDTPRPNDGPQQTAPNYSADRTPPAMLTLFNGARSSAADSPLYDALSIRMALSASCALPLVFPHRFAPVRAAAKQKCVSLAQIFRYINWSSSSQIIIYEFSVLEEKLSFAEKKSRKVKVKAFGFLQFGF